jgi:hypothetical protein
MAELSSSVAIFFFMAVFAAYSYYKYKKGGDLSFGVQAAFFAVLIIGEYFINLAMSKDICGFDQQKTALLATIIPWILVIGVLKSALIVFPGWLTPFGNTFGYIFVSAVTDLKDVFNSILTPQFDLDPESATPASGGGHSQGGGGEEGVNPADLIEDSIANKRDIGRALEQIYTDQSILLNELNRDNLDKFWNSFKASKLIKASAKLEELEKIRSFLTMKTVVGEFVWLVLCGLLVVSISYNYILNIGCTFTPEQQKMREEVLEEQQAATKLKKEKDKNNIVLITS